MTIRVLLLTGKADKNTARTFYNAITFFDILEQFDDGVDDEIVQKVIIFKICLFTFMCLCLQLLIMFQFSCLYAEGLLQIQSRRHH